MHDRCEIAGCRTEADLSYLGHGVCSNHWNELTAEDAAPDALRMALGIEASVSTAKEVAMSETKKSESKTKKAAKATPAVEAKAKKERPPQDATRVFAIRVTDQELEGIHRAAGPRNATRMIRAVAAAFATEDEAAFKAVLKEAKEARQ